MKLACFEGNRLLNPADLDTLEPLDFTPDIDPPFKVCVADVTTDQWERIPRTPESILPSG
jgi:hypothetical protein